jgi:hypothetical protein
MEKASHTATWLPAKVALGDLVVAISACRVRALSARAPTIRSASLLYALVDPKRHNRPSTEQLRDVILMVKAAERKADELEQRPALGSVEPSSHQNSNAS